MAPQGRGILVRRAARARRKAFGAPLFDSKGDDNADAFQDDDLRIVVTVNPTFIPPLMENHMMKKSLIALTIALTGAGAWAQAGTAVKEAGKATAETTKQGVENVKAAASSEPEKTVHKVKAKVHKAKAKDAAEKSKAAAKEAVK